jgi:hypothetical protein
MFLALKALWLRRLLYTCLEIGYDKFDSMLYWLIYCILPEFQLCA